MKIKFLNADNCGYVTKDILGILATLIIDRKQLSEEFICGQECQINYFADTEPQ